VSEQEEDLNLARALSDLHRLSDPQTSHEVREGIGRALKVGLEREGEKLRRRWQSVDQADIKDAEQDVAVRLVTNPARRAFDTDAKASAYLRTAIERALIDRFRAARRRGELTEGSGPETGDAPAYGSEDARRAAEHLEHRIIPAATERLGPQVRDRFAQAIDELRAIRNGQRTVEDIVRREIGPEGEPGSAVWKRVRNRVDQRICRTIRKLIQELDREIAEGEVDSEFERLVRRTLDGLRPSHG
jgi:DNA-directed RNA polymerase specialized sigma24 family protein